MSDKIFCDGLFAKKREGSPVYVLSSISIKVPEFIPFLEKHRNNAGYVNIDLMLSQKGSQYCTLNTFQPTRDNAKVVEDNQSQLNNFDKEENIEIMPVVNGVDYPTEEIDINSIPF
jgi:hypothetical protein